MSNDKKRGAGRGGRRNAGGLPSFLGGSTALVWLVAAGCTTVASTDSSARQAVIDRVVAASARVTIEKGGRRVRSGSGVVVDSRVARPGTPAISHVLTAAHVLDGARDGEIFVRFTGVHGGRERFTAVVARRGDPETLDLALLRIPGVFAPYAWLVDGDQVRLGEEILVVGFPWGRRLGLFGGIVSQVPVEGGGDGTSAEAADPRITVDAAVSSGVSGGGVFRLATGSLLGVVEGYQTASIAVKGRSQAYSVQVPMPGETYVVPIARIRRFLADAGLGGAAGAPRGAGEREDGRSGPADGAAPSVP